MPPGSRLPKGIGWVIVPLLVVPVALAVRPIEGTWFFVVAGAICFAAPLGGLWWGEGKGETEGTRAALGCVGTLGLFAVYALWAFVLARLIFDR